MLASTVNPAQILNSYRRVDAVVIVCQNNAKKLIEIAAINDAAGTLLGYSNDEVIGKSLSHILTERISSTIEEFVEFHEHKNDLFFVLSKIRNFSIKTKDGQEKEFKLRIIHGESMDGNPWFHLVLVDEEKLRRGNAFRSILHENFKGHEVIDEHTGLPDRASLVKDIEMLVYHVRAREISASFAIIEINNFDELCEKHGQQIGYKVHQHVGQICKMKLRADDTIGSLSERSLGILLLEAPQEPAHMVLNRLRWTVNVSPLAITEKKEITVQINIGFAQIDGQISDAEVLSKCESFMESIRNTSTNSIHLIVTHERRQMDATTDRRKQTLRIEVERRKKERRGSMGPKKLPR